jgi:hypothetical protein
MADLVTMPVGAVIALPAETVRAGEKVGHGSAPLWC